MVSAGGSAAAFARLPLWVLLRVWRCRVLGTLAQPGRSLGGPWTQGPPPLRSRGAGWSTSHVLMEAGGAWTGAWVGWGSATARNPGTAVQWVGACQWKAGPCTGQQLGQQGLEGPVDRRGSGTRERVHSAPRGWLLKERGPRGSSVGSPVPSAEMKHWGQAGGGQDLSAGKAGAGLHVAWGGWAPRGMEWGGHQASHPQDRRRLWLEGLCGHVGTMSTGTLDLERAPSRIWRLEPWRLGLWAGLPGVTGGPQTTAGDGARTQHPEREGQ